MFPVEKFKRKKSHPLVIDWGEDTDKYFKLSVFDQLRLDGIQFPTVDEDEKIWRKVGEEYFKIPGVIS